MKNQRSVRKLQFLFGLTLAAALTASIPFSAATTVPSLTDTIDPLPGPACVGPIHLALNNTTKRAYVGGGGAIEFGANGRVSVVDAQTKSVLKNFSLPYEVNNVALNEKTNTVYLCTYSGPVGNQLQPSVVVLDGATNQITKEVNTPLGNQVPTVDPVSGRIFAWAYSFNPDVVSVYDGATLNKISDIQLSDGTRSYRAGHIALNPVTRKVYVTAGSNDVATVAVIDADSLALSFVQINSTGADNVVVDSSVNRAYVYARQPNGSGGSKPVILVISGSSVTQTINLLDFDFPDVFAGATIDLVRHRAYFSIGNSPRRTRVIDTINNTLAGTVAQDFHEGGVLTSTGQIFAAERSTNSVPSFASHNAVGVIDPTNSTATEITVGYTPFQAAINAQTGRLYIGDKVGIDLLVFNAADHSLLARVPVGVTRDLAVSEALNRVYLTRSAVSDDGTTTSFLDVLDGANNQQIQTIPVASNSLAGAGVVAVDDTRHRVYVIATTFDGSSYQSTMFVFNTDTNALITSFPTVQSVLAIGVNPVNGKIYVASNNNGGFVQIFDPTTFAQRALVSAGRVPGPMAFNRTTNKVFVANIGAGSVDNTITVIDGATDAVVTTILNISENNGSDAITSVAVDEATNTVFAGDNGNQFTANGYISVFNGASNYAYVGHVPVGHFPERLVFDHLTHQLFVTNDVSGNISVLGSGVPAGPPVPLHGGLSATVFRVDGKSTPSANVADTVLRFAAQQSGTPAGLKVRVQINTAPNNDVNDWVDLNNGSGGYMTVDKNTGQFVLSSTNYPLVNGLYFRALSTASGYPDSKSNIVGPFSLSGSQNHLGSTTLFVATNGPGQEMKFRVKVAVDQAAIALRVQTTMTPDDDSSWAYLNDGNSGGMHPFADPKQFYLDTTKYPAGDAVYFRAIATAPGFVNSISNILGVTHVVAGTPPEVSALPSSFDLLKPGSGSGLSPNDPLILALGSMKFTVQASSPENKALTAVGLIYDGTTINKWEGTAVSGTLNTDYTTSVPGDHVIKAFAKDERGIVGYAEPVYLRILPPAGKVFTMTNSGDWSDPNTWQDASGQGGVPGANDLAVIVNGKQVTVSRDVVALAISLLNGTVDGAGGTLKVPGAFSITAGQLRNLALTIDAHGTLAINSKTDVPVSGSVSNLGTIRILSTGSIIPVPSSSVAAMRDGTSSTSNFNFLDGIGALFNNVGDFIFHHPSVKPAPASPPQNPPKIPAPRGVSAASFENKGRLLSENGLGLVTDNGSGALSDNGAGLIAPNGAAIISNDGASLITNDGGSVISNDSASLITNDGGSLITNDGGSLITNDGGSLRVRPNAAGGSKFKAATAASAFIQSGGQLDLRHLLVMSPLNVNGGVVLGSGVIYGDLTNNSGYVSPGHSAGAISVLGNFTQATGGTLIMENGGAIGGQSDSLQISGSATLGGRIDLRAINGYAPSPSDAFSPLSYSSVSGTFSSVSSNATLSLNANGVLASNNISAPQPSTGQPLNIATRLQLQGGNNGLIEGFIITGPSGSTKKVLIRGIGPSLAQYNIPGLLTDPFLELHDGAGGLIVANDNWQSGDTSLIPTAFQPTDPRESVIVATLTVGSNGSSAYSAVLKGAHGETGVGVAEVYDFETASAAKLANIATRGFVQTGDNVMIGGFIIGGTEPAKVLVRVTGPTLAKFGITGQLDDPTLELHDANGGVISNDNWRETQESEIIATTIPPADDREPAILATLVPGGYSAVVRGKSDTTGIAVVEAYNLQ